MNKLSEICYYRMKYTILQYRLELLQEDLNNGINYITLKAKIEFCSDVISRLKRNIKKQNIINAFNQLIRKYTIEIICSKICNYHNITFSEIIVKTRKRSILEVRQIAMYFSKELTKESLSSIGLKIGGKGHATVLHACKVVNNLKETDKKFAKKIEDIEGLF